MEVLILGLSSLVQRRVLPALLALPQVQRIHVASRSGDPRPLIPEPRRGLLLSDYQAALEQCPPCLCYVSLPNSLHAVWAERALAHGFHVILDKPATINLAEALMLTQLAQSRGLCLAEANVWTWHPMARAFQELIAEQDAPPQAAMAVFTSPPLNAGNFRYQPRFGAGALLDRGPYAVSCGRFLFGEPPMRVSCEIVSAIGDGQVDTSFSTTLTYPGGAVLIGFFSLETVYRNTLSIIGRRYACDAERIFTPPADFQATISVTKGQERQAVQLEPGDTFAAFLEAVMDGILREDHAHFAETLLQDAAVLEEMRKAAGHRS